MTTVRERVYASLQETAASDDDLADAVLVGFLVVADWQGPATEANPSGRWLSKVSGNHSEQLPDWQERGYAAELLHAFWRGNTDEVIREDDVE